MIYMLWEQYTSGCIRLHISNYLEFKRKLKSLTGEQKRKINKGMNINV